jgi:hypothetical protein
MLALAVGWPTALQAQSPELEQMKAQVAELAATVKKLTSVVNEQQKTITALSKRQVETTALAQDVSNAQKAASSPVAMAAQPVAGVGGAVIPFIPEIGMVADIVGTSTQSKEDLEGNDRLSVREVELIVGHDIDPYSRFDSTITFSDTEDPSVEEAYVTYWGLPLDLKGRIGRIKPKVGRATATHRDSLETVDQPLVVQRYLGVEGLSRTGLELSGFTPWSTDSITQQLYGGMMEGGAGEDGQMFGPTRRIPTFYAHLGNSVEVSELTNGELGATYMLGSKNEDSTYDVNVVGLDATLSHYITPRNKLKFQNEFYFQHRSPGVSDPASDIIDISTNTPWGFYSLLDYRLAERWGVGSRYDLVEPVDNSIDSPRDSDQAISG